MKLWRFIVKNVLRNRRRTLLTVVSLAASLFIVNTLASVLRGFEGGDTSDESHLRLIVRHRVSLANDLPEAYWDKIKQVPHVKTVTPWTWFGGVYKDQSWENMFARFSTDPDSYLALTADERAMPEEQARAWREDRRGAITGQALAKKQGWKLGDTIVIKGDIYPVDIELILRGIFTAKRSDDEEALFFHHMYLEELNGRPGSVGTYWLKVDAPENLAGVGRTIDAMFENSDAETKSETEKQFLASFISMMGNVKGLIQAIGLVVTIAILMVSANTMAMAVRERTTEVAVMKAIGFPPGRILFAIVGESVVISLAACAVACLASFLLFNLTGARLPGFWTPMAISLQSAAVVVAIAFTIGLVSGILPGILAARLSVVDGLRKVA